MQGRSLTTKNIAECCQVTQRTAVQWINEGKLKAFRTLGKHIRIDREDFIEFLIKYQIPVPKELVAPLEGKGKKKILIVDDEEGMVDAIKRGLSKEKIFDLEVAYDGFEAGTKFSEYKPDLVILDLCMPGINGYELCTKIRNEIKNKDVKILAISGVANQKEIERIMSLGANDYLLKPFNNKELKIKIAGLFDWNRRVKDRAGQENRKRKF